MFNTFSIVGIKITFAGVIILCLGNARLGVLVADAQWCLTSMQCQPGTVCYNGTCIVAVNECAMTPGICGVNATCTDTPRSYICSCLPGFAGFPPTGTCTNINECEFGNPCVRNAVCTDTIGSFTCTCLSGYSGVPPRCTNKNECLSSPGPCGTNAVCIDTLGSYVCRCPAGYTGSPPGIPCTNINACLLTPGLCGTNAGCIYSSGSYVCRCSTGYTGSPPNAPCTNINECTANPGICGVNAICTDKMGDFVCSCYSGFTGSPPSIPCTPNINECLTTPGICGSNSKCTDTPNSYSCSCGYFFFYGTDGIFMSYQSHVNGTVVLTAPPGLRVRIHFTRVAIECCRGTTSCKQRWNWSSAMCQCDFDYVNVYDSNGSLGLRFCGIDIQSYISSGQTLTINSVSDGMYNFGGFRATFCYV